jgi:hypothetical protein
MVAPECLRLVTRRSSVRSLNVCGIRRELGPLPAPACLRPRRRREAKGTLREHNPGDARPLCPSSSTVATV